jgi:anti-sigma factor RsiW
MTSSKPDLDSIKYLIPLYLKGGLSETQRAEVEKALQEFPGLKDEMKSWKEIAEAYRAIEEKLPQPPAEAYFQISQKISEMERPRWFAWFRLSPVASFALITAQLVIIIALGIYLMNLRMEYRTLSAPSWTAGMPAKMNVVFKENATEAEIRNLLSRVGGKIIDGPSLSGLYIIGIVSDKDWQNSLVTLKQSKIVEMAERTYP